jgi:threonine dehydratase
MELERPTLRDVLRARTVINRYLTPTPLIRYPAIDQLVGAEVWVKHENVQPVVAAEERRRGVIAASTGNHGQSVAYAAKLFGVPAIIGMPERANPVKVEAMRNLGAEVIFHGPDYDAARVYVEDLAAERGYRYIHSGNEPLLIAGVGTITLEILEEQPEIDTIIVPVGGGSGAAAAAIVAKAIDPAIRVIGVQSEGAPAAWRSWKERQLVETETLHTFAEGLATRTAFAFPQAIMQDLLDDFILVSEAEIAAAVRLYLAKAHTLAEGAGAAPLAAALRLKGQLADRRIALILSGGNLSPDQLQWVLGTQP